MAEHVESRRRRIAQVKLVQVNPTSDPKQNASAVRPRPLCSSQGGFGKLIAVLSILAVVGCAGTARETAETEERTKRTEPVNELAFLHFSNGSILMTDGQTQAAIRAYEKALLYDPQSYEIRMSLADGHVRQRQYEQAAAIAEGIIEKDARVYGLLGRAYAMLGRNDQARAAYEKVIEFDKDDTQAYWFLSRQAVRQGDLRSAIGHLEAMSEYVRDSRVQNEIAELHTRLDDHAGAAAAYSMSLQFDSSMANRRAWVGLAEALNAQTLRDEAEDVYRRMMAIAPDDHFARRQLIQLLLDEGDHEVARRELEALLTDNPADPERMRLGVLLYNAAQYDRAESLFTVIAAEEDPYIPFFYLGRIAFTRERFAAAKDYFRRAVETDDTLPDAWIAWGNTLLAEDSLEAALELSQRAEQRAPDPADFWYFTGVALARHDQHDSAVVWLRRAWDADTANARVQFSLAASLERSGHFNEAAAQFNSLLQREPDNASALNYLGYMYADSGINLQESLQLIEKAVDIDPDNGAYLDSYAWVLYRLGRLSEAEGMIKRAADVLSSDAVIHDHYGDILAAMGRRDEAAVRWRRALELDPGNRPIIEKLGIDP